MLSADVVREGRSLGFLRPFERRILQAVLYRTHASIQVYCTSHSGQVDINFSPLRYAVYWHSLSCPKEQDVGQWSAPRTSASRGPMLSMLAGCRLVTCCAANPTYPSVAVYKLRAVHARRFVKHAQELQRRVPTSSQGFVGVACSNSRV